MIDQGQSTQYDNLKKNIVAASFSEMERLCAALEERKPGDAFGTAKLTHVRELVEALEGVAATESLSPRVTMLLVIAGSCHDIGRPIETMMALDTLRPGRRHGFIGADHIEEKNILNGLCDEDKGVILNAVRYHAEKNVELTPGSDAYRICYILRDLDKLEGLSAAKYMEPNGILDQLQKHYSKRHNLDFSGDNLEVLRVIGSFLPLSAKCEAIEGTAVGDENPISNILKTGIDSDVIQVFSKQEQIDIARVGDSYATYMLWLCAWTFDIQSPSVLAMAYKDPELHKKLGFALNRVGSEDGETIVTALANNFATKLTGEHSVTLESAKAYLEAEARSYFQIKS